MEYDKLKDLHIKQDPTKLVLFIHGIFASYMDFEEILPGILDAGYSVYAIKLLPNSNNTKDYTELKKDTWVNQVNILIDSLLIEYKEISIIAHSLGCALTLQYPRINELKRLVLWAPAMKTKVSLYSTRIGLMNTNKSYNNEYFEICKKKGSINVHNMMDRLRLIKPSLGLMYAIKQAKKNLSNITNDVMLVLSKKDESVRLSSSKYIQERIKSELKVEYILEHSRHNNFDEKEKLIIDEMISFITKEKPF